MFGNKESKQEKQEVKAQELMKKYGLGDVSPKYADAVRQIASELAGTGMMETGMRLSMAKAEDALTIYYLRAILQQNFIIIRELDAIAKK